MLFNLGHIIDDRYEIIDLIGSGGFGEVYKTKDITLEDFNALKCLLPQIVEEQPELVEMFDEEANAAMQVEHPNVVRIFSIEESNFQNERVKYFTMEYSEDGDLGKFLRNQETYLTIEKLKDWINQLLLGLKAINKKLIHRDLKPGNVLLFGNSLKISDFGLSRYIEESTRTLTFKGGGTPQYMAPEVWEQASPTHLLDQYSMGMIFYVLATLQHPFSPIPSSVNTSEFLRDKHLFSTPQPPKELNAELPDKLSSIIMRMIEKRPTDRFSNLDDILNALENIEEEERADVSPEILEIAGIAKKSDQKIKEEGLRKAEQRKRQEEEAVKIRNTFDFHCKELISDFEKIIDYINEKIEPVKIVKRKGSDDSLYYFQCSFHKSLLVVHIEQVGGVDEVEDIIGWGYCYIHENEDGFNLLLQKSSKSSYGKWLALFTQDHPLYNYVKYKKPHGVLNLKELNNALRCIRVSGRYQSKLIEFNEGIFIELVKKLVSL